MAATGFMVRPTALDAEAQQLGTDAGALETAKSDVAATTLPGSAFGAVEKSAAAAGAHQTSVSATTDALTTDKAHAERIRDGLTKSAAGYRDADAKVAAAYKSILPAADQAKSAIPTPAGGGPFAGQIAANQGKVADALASERQTLDGLIAQRAKVAADKDGAGLAGFVYDGKLHDLDKQISQAQGRVALYQDIVDNHRQIVQFDPNGTGKIVELFGTIDSNTRNVGVLVPGTNASIDDYAGYASTAKAWTDADPNHGLAMLVYNDGRNPQNLLTGSPFPSYAHTMAPDLASFSHDLRDQVTTYAPGAQISYVPHSYAASTVGAAEQLGLTTDKVIDVEGAGVGPGVWQPSDLPDYGQVQRYSMTAPHDPIALVQGSLGPIHSPHGADPDTFPGTTRLDAGNVPHNGWLGPVDYTQHTAVLKPYSDAWWNIFNAMTGGPVKTQP